MKKMRTSSKMNALFALLVVLVIAATFMFNAVTLVLSNYYPLSVDLNENAAYMIGDETRRLLDSLTGDVTVYVLAQEGSFDGNAYLVQARNILNQYPKYSRHITLEYIDYFADPSIAARFSDLSLAEGNVLVCANDKVRQIALADLFNYTYSASGEPVIASSRAEETLSSAILNVLSDHIVRLGVLSGNGVSDMATFTKLLADNNYEVESVNLVGGEFSAYDGLMLFAPTVDLAEDVLDKLDAFLYNGGEYGKRLVVTADVAQPVLPNLEAFLNEWGVRLGSGAVFETKSERTYSYQPYYPLTDYTDTERAAKLKDAGSLFLAPLSREMDTVFASRDNRYTETLLSFGESAGVRPADAPENFTAADADTWGPMPALVLSSVRILGNTGVTQKRSDILVSGSTRCLSAEALQNSSLSNSEYILNLFGELFERDDTVNIEAKSLAKATMGVTTAQSRTLGIVLAGVLPAAILALGIVIWLMRRYR